MSVVIILMNKATEMHPLRALLDASAVRNIGKAPRLVEKLRTLSASGRVVCVLCRTTSEELWEGQRNGKGAGPPPFPVTYVGNTVGRVGVLACGDSLGAGEVYDAHRAGGRSRRREADALVADAARLHAQVFVTDDKRCLSRFKRAARGTRVLTSAEFAAEMDSRLAAHGQDPTPLQPGDQALARTTSVNP